MIFFVEMFFRNKENDSKIIPFKLLKENCKKEQCRYDCIRKEENNSEQMKGNDKSAI